MKTEFYTRTIVGLFNVSKIEDEQWRKGDVALSYSKWYPNTTAILAMPKAEKKHPERKSSFALYGFLNAIQSFTRARRKKSLGVVITG